MSAFLMFIPIQSPRWLLFALLLGITACSKPVDTAEVTAASAVSSPGLGEIAVQVQAVGTATRPQTQTYSGTIEAENTADLAFSVAGSVRRVLVREGDQVRAGQLLAELNAEEYASALAGANASLQETRDHARRAQQLFAGQSLTERELVQATAGLQRAEATARVARKHVADTYLRAPFAGLIAAKLVEPGVSAAPGAPAFRLIKTEQVFAQAVVPEVEIGWMRRGTSVQVLVPALGREFQGRVQVINPVADPASRSFQLKVLLPNPGLRLLPGMRASLQIPLPAGQGTPVVAVAPQLVVQEADGASVVYVADAAGHTAQRRRVVLGPVQGNQVVVSQGLAAHEQIIMAGQQRLHDGQAIRIIH
ncbi:efflux RND transporter periplasmic adaptor subunit [Hymenobacter tibetensis]|uniref:Efflux RND transporter periplasmic adaptor subunit n=1 Tax=Hymenobacter tibetensis TaxID=497967 RepID=A0ABY4CT34_9BACT|nr:efflux RND transporter periplasmic adaptor subunit [Hymenobacter tibetensis]UOG73348.1 efflux RND transporter periplasmic adaptor subunit [Hymenobacter tibetensis]